MMELTHGRQYGERFADRTTRFSVCTFIRAYNQGIPYILGGGIMEALIDMAKVTTKGQITIPAAIRKALGIKTGDKVLFVDKGDGAIEIRNATLLAFSNAQRAFEGAAEEAGLRNEDDVVKLVKTVRHKRAIR